MGEAEKKTDFLDYLSVLVRWRRFIIINVLCVTLLAVIVSFIMPKWYRATASVLPPKEPDMFGSLGAASSVLRGLSGTKALRGLGQNEGAYNYFAILKSRTAMEAVVRHFALIDVYDVPDTSMEKAVKALTENTSFETGDDDNITIQVLDKEPQRAADMANYFVDLLNEISIKLGTQEARSNREFIEKRLEKAKSDLRHAEDTLRGYQEKSGMIIAIDPTSPTVSGIAELYGMKAKKEIELAILKRTVSSDNMLARRTEIELAELNKKVSTFPGIGMGSLRLYRELAIQQKIIEFLLPMYEQAKVDEQKDVPVLLVLDKAVAPERKVKPQRMLIVFLAATLSVFACVLLAFLLHGLTQRKGALRPLESKLQGYARRIAARYRILSV
jgi:tyrosine-protein kinase Etk/Wzc